MNEWVKERAGDPLYFFGRSGPTDPRSQTEDLGNDAVAASNYGIANLKIILGQLVDWTEEEAKDYDDLTELYGQVATQWNRYVGHVLTNVGGHYENFKTYDQDGVVYTPVEKERQEAAMDWLRAEVFTTPEWLIDMDILRRIEGVGMMNRIRQYQVGAVNRVLDLQRLARMMESEALGVDDVYTVSEMFADLRDGIWGELGSGAAISPFRRSLQRGHIERLEYLMTTQPPPLPAFFASIGFTNIDVSQSDLGAYARAELHSLQRDIRRARARTRDTLTRHHLDDLNARISDILEEDH